MNYKEILTNKHSSRNGNKISKIIIHHMAAIWTAEQCANYFRNTHRDCSANYCVSDDGVVMNVQECYRAWTSGNREFDEKSITIETADADTNWNISQTTLNNLYDLCADICDRYDIDLHYTGNTDGTLLYHKMLQPTACPGNFLIQKIQSGEFEKEVKKRQKKECSEMGCKYWDGTKCTKDTQTQTQTNRKSNDEIAKEVIRGNWGNGADRKNRLTAAGYDYATIQNIVNKMLS